MEGPAISIIPLTLRTERQERVDSRHRHLDWSQALPVHFWYGLRIPATHPAPGARAAGCATAGFVAPRGAMAARMRACSGSICSAKASPAEPSATHLTVAPTVSSTPTEINTVAPTFMASAWSMRMPPGDRSRTRCFVGAPPPKRSTVALSITLARRARVGRLSAGSRRGCASAGLSTVKSTASPGFKDRVCT